MWEPRKEHSQIQKECVPTMVPANMVVVPLQELKCLQSQVAAMKRNVSAIVNANTLNAYYRAAELQTEVGVQHHNLLIMEAERDHWKSRCDTAREEADGHKQEKYSMQCELQELTSQLNQQTDFCASLGSACCTLLWRVSRSEESIQTILTGSKAEAFMVLVNSTIQSFVETYTQSLTPADVKEETQFILAMCGVITNIAASPFGRNYLMSHEAGRQVVDVFLSALADSPSRKCGKMKTLILMALYNITINQKGLAYISNRRSIINLLAWLLQEEREKEIQLNVLRLLQSLLCEQRDPQLLQQAARVLTDDLMRKLASDQCADVREAARELHHDLEVVNSEQ